VAPSPIPMPSMRESEEVVNTATTPTIVFTSTVQPRPGSRSPGHSPCMSPARASWPFAMRSPNRAAPPCGRHRQRPAQGRPVVLTTHAGRGVTYTEDARRTRRHTRRLGSVWYLAPSGSNGRRWGPVRQLGARRSRCRRRADHGGGRRRVPAALDEQVERAAAGADLDALAAISVSFPHHHGGRLGLPLRPCPDHRLDVEVVAKPTDPREPVDPEVNGSRPSSRPSSVSLPGRRALVAAGSKAIRPPSLPRVTYVGLISLPSHAACSGPPAQRQLARKSWP
jgi:hypothetical protein